MYIYIRTDATKKDHPPHHSPALARQPLHRPQHLRQTPLRLQSNPPHLHGPYHRWTGFIHAKRTTKTLRPEQVRECKKRIRNYRALEKQIRQLLRQALQEAPWNQPRPNRHR